MIEFEIKERVLVGNRDIVASVEKMKPEHRLDILEKLVGIETTEKQKWNFITSARMLLKADLLEGEIANLIIECNRITSELTSKYKAKLKKS